MKIPNIRLLNQQLLSPLFSQPKELVSWMGAMQAQNYSMVKWAVGMRLKSATIQTVEKALRDGEILRTHVMRPTWHLVAAEDIRWMLKLSQVGIVCSGEDKGSKCTYALLEERVPPMPELTKDESLARLARSYFRSHAPAVLQDFVWWSGLPITDARQAIYLIDSELTAEEWNGQTWYIHEDCRTRGKVTGSLHLLPSYDEYLLGYKDRTDVLPKEHYSKAFTNNGLFYPIVLHEGQVIGNWDKSVKKRGSLIEHSWFRLDDCVDEGALDREKDKYIRFWR